jgi:hypothetical protein
VNKHSMSKVDRCMKERVKKEKENDEIERLSELEGKHVG